jgi:hypothetical protein
MGQEENSAVGVSFVNSKESIRIELSPSSVARHHGRPFPLHATLREQWALPSSKEKADGE